MEPSRVASQLPPLTQLQYCPTGLASSVESPICKDTQAFIHLALLKCVWNDTIHATVLSGKCKGFATLVLLSVNTDTIPRKELSNNPRII